MTGDVRKGRTREGECLCSAQRKMRRTCKCARIRAGDFRRRLRSSRSASKRPLTSAFERAYERREKQKGKKGKRAVPPRGIFGRNSTESESLIPAGEEAVMRHRDASR